MILFYKSFIVLAWTRLALGTIPGISYMDPIRQMPFGSSLPGEDPCKPLYWYPRAIPEYCYLKPPVTINYTKNPPLPVPLPVPMPSPQLIPVPDHLPLLPMPLPIMPPPPPIMPPPAFPIALSPLYAQSPMLPTVPADPLMAYDTNPQPPHFPFPYPNHEPQVGFVPGLPTLVKRDGGINIMPFSDVYADMLEKHKYKMIRKKLRRIINEYEHIPNTRKYLRLKKFDRLMGL